MSKRLGSLVAGLALAVGLFAACAPAEARQRRGHHARPQIHVRHYVHIRKHRAHRVHRIARAGRVAGGPPTAEYVVDANSGKVLYAHNENELRHPASLTKIMTLYMLFEQLEKGKFRLDSDLTVSAHSASMAPSKLGLRPGSTIEVEDAIKAIVTKSANDIAATVAEAIGGDEATFSEMMTSKARSLGMSRTNFANASGLPNPRQITTARDLAILGRAIQDRFPKYYRYFSTRTFYYGGRAHGNHNHLLGRVEGMDGIKTGYTAASGFNLVTSVRRDGRHLVSVVLGGRTARARDNLMANLIEEHLEDGARGRTALAFAETEDDTATIAKSEKVADRMAAAPSREPAREPMRLGLMDVQRIEPPARIETAAARQPAPVVQPAVVRAEAPTLKLAIPMTAVEAERARAVAEKPRPAYVSGVRVASLDPIPEKTATRAAPRAPVVADGSTTRRAPSAATPTATPSTLRWVAGAQPAARPRGDSAADKDAAKAHAKLSGRTEIAKADPKADAKKPVVAETHATKPGWIIQIGATDDVGKANDLLSRAKGRSRTVAAAQAFTEKVQKGKETLYRARFAGLPENAAENACRELKRSGFSCFAMKN